MIQFCTIDKDKRRISKGVYTLDKIPANYAGHLGAMIPDDCVVLDIDSHDGRARAFIDSILKARPNLFITKTAKDGGYHLWFKTKEQIDRCAGKLISIFGWKFDVLTGVNNYITMPDNFENRYYFNGFGSLFELVEGWDDYSQYITKAELESLMPYVYKTNDHATPLELSDGGRNAGLLEWLGYCASQGVHPDTMRMHTDVLAEITGLHQHEIQSTILASLSKYSARDSQNKVDDIPIFKGDALPEIQHELIKFIKENDLFSYDEATGIYYCNIGEHKHKTLSQPQFIELMQLFFTKKLWYIKRDAVGIVKGAQEVSMADRATLFKTIAPYISFNSRRAIYDNIPKWDGTERINTFMKEYYECDANPNFTWLLLTAIVGKLKEPERCYCPYFFDFVGNKGVGKTLLPQRLVGNLWAFLQHGRAYDDMFVNVYNVNAVVAIDDECTLVGPGYGKLSYDQFKNFVTARTDQFSRKNAQPEVHPRSFIIVRTSNDTKTGWALDERRQIIFESMLPKNACRIRPDEVPDEFFQQLLAEAKVYYERYGMYNLKESDWACVEQQLVDSFNTEDANYIDALTYINWAINKAKMSPYEPNECFIHRVDDGEHKFYINWNTYNSWCLDKMTKPMPSRIFWNEMAAVEAKTGKLKTGNSLRLRIDGSLLKVGRLVLDDAKADDTPIESRVERTSVANLVAKVVPPEEQIKVRSSKIAEELGAVKCDHKDVNRYTTHALLKECPRNVQWFFEQNANDVSTMTPTPIDVNGLTITYGIGGLHAAEKDYKGENLVYMDVKSMYPNLMIMYNMLSRSIPDPSVYEGWVLERLRLKAQGHPHADDLKLKINSVYGLMKAPWCALYDPYMASSVAVLGQTVMTILITNLQEHGCKIINANTDGLIVDVNLASAWMSACKVWEKNTGLTLEMKEIKTLEQADVNNYRAEYKDGTVVCKGAKYKDKK